MWTRSELKIRAKNTIRKYFWPALSVSMLNSLFNSNGGSTSSSGAQAGANISEEMGSGLEGIFSGGIGAVLDELPRFAENIVSSLDSAMTSILLIVALIGITIALTLGVFVAPVIEVGKNRFYMKSRQMGRSAGVGCLLWGFKNNYLNIIWTMLVRNVLVLLATFCFVIPGIYLAYCYHMVPYILAENPDMKTSDALRMSMDMMRGNKFNTWLLKISFVGWWILGALACGIGTYLVYPYYDATFAELYAVLRNPYTNYLNGFGSEWQETEYQNDQQFYQHEAERRYDYSCEQPISKETTVYAEPITNTEPKVVTEQPEAEICSETVHSEEKKVRGYYLNGVFHPYTDEELKELEKNGY